MLEPQQPPARTAELMPSGREGTVQQATFSLGGQKLMATDSTVRHEIGHNPYLSLYVQCDSDEEIEHLYKSLSAGGSTPMPLDSYGFSPSTRV
jgi:predicted 3-demethylubiquinone-9 3-methyltransferase (glyoxalase superfamily)